MSETHENLNDDLGSGWFASLIDQAFKSHNPKRSIEEFLDTRRRHHLPALVTGLAALESRIELEQEEPQEGSEDKIALLAKFKILFEKRIHELERRAM